MRLAILSDIHGNAVALRAVLDALAGEPLDGVLFGGDYALFGPRPAESIDLVRETGGVAIYGNTEIYVGRDSLPIHEWTRAQIGAERLAWLAALPFSHRVDDLLLVHASPTDVEAVLAVESSRDTPATSAERARELMGDARADLVVHGHIHYATAGEVDGQRVASVGAVGFPFDEDRRAAYAIATRDSGTWTLEHRRVEYDVEAVIADIEACGMPLAAGLVRRLREARPLPLN